MSNNRKKGHDLERQVARDLKNKFPYVRTARAASKQLDDCGIDIVGIPLLIQCKNGYSRKRPNYEDLYYGLKSKIKDNFPPNHFIHNTPFFLVHKLDVGKGQKRDECHTQVTMSYDTFLNLIINYPNIENLNLIGL